MVVGALATGRTGLAVGLCWLLAAGCSGDDGDAAGPTTAGSVVTTTTVPPRPTTTTSLVYDPATVEGQVEAAYLRSWEVYAAAVYDLVLDEAALASVYAEPLLSHRRDEVLDRIERGHAAMVRVDHNLTITVAGNTALVLDSYINHQVLIDPRTKDPVEADPNQRLNDVFRAEHGPQGWRIAAHQRAE